VCLQSGIGLRCPGQSGCVLVREGLVARDERAGHVDGQLGSGRRRLAAVATLPGAGDVGAAGSAVNNDRARWTAASTMAHACKTDTS